MAVSFGGRPQILDQELRLSGTTRREKRQGTRGADRKQGQGTSCQTIASEMPRVGISQR